MPIEELSQYNKQRGVWHNWKVPYYQAIREGVISLDNRYAMNRYCKLYGMADMSTEMTLLLNEGE